MAKFKPGRAGNFKEIEEFVSAHRGVEAYLEPKTRIHEASVLLVSSDRAWKRIESPDVRRLNKLAAQRGVPVYDASVVGYPDVMGEAKVENGPDVPSAEELEQWWGGSE